MGEGCVGRKGGRGERIDDFFCESRDDGGERGADDDGDGEVHDVATQNEVAESLEHERLLEFLTCRERNDGARSGAASISRVAWLLRGAFVR